jgi:hypothetical protein
MDRSLCTTAGPSWVGKYFLGTNIGVNISYLMYHYGNYYNNLHL